MDVIEAPFRSAVDRRSASDRTHIGDIVGAIGTVASHDVGPRRSLRRRLVTLAAVLVVNQEMAVRLGAVTGAGHARLIVERFGRTWGRFALGDLLVVNLLTIVTEFIGVTLALGYFGVSRYVAVPIAAAALVAVTSSGSFRRWERAMYALIATNVLMVPLVLLAHAHAGAGTGSGLSAGLLPSFPGGNEALLLVVALIGTTVAPWQLFFQQSNVVDKRITARWLHYERIDTVIGAVIVLAGAGAVMFAASTLHGSGIRFQDAGAVAAGLRAGSGTSAGALFAVVLFNASILGAAAVTLASSYAIGDYAGLKHSLHRKWRDAPAFYGSYVAAVSLGAAIVLLPGAPLGIVTTAVQALAGVLLPSALVFLLLLCNDREVLGPWTNPRWLNMLGVLVVTVLLILSGTLTVTTVFPHADPALVASTIAGMGAVALGLWGYALWSARHEPVAEADTPWQRTTWTMPWAERIGPPGATRARAVGLLVLRAYLLGAAALVVVKATQLALGG